MLRALAGIAIVTLAVSLGACGPKGGPTSTTPLTPGSASIEPSPATAETVPKSAPKPSASPASTGQ